jgi:hypothetical protein
MAFRVDDFRNNLVGDGARGNLFEVQIPAFPAFANLGTAPDKLRFMAKSAQLPASTLGTVTMQYFGREVKVAGNRTYQDWSINIINDEDFLIRKAMELWVNAINDPVQNLRDVRARNVDNGYGVDAFVVQYSKSGNQIQTYRFHGLFPVDVAAIDLDWGNNDAVEEFSVNFAYQYWEALGNPKSTIDGAPVNLGAVLA